MTPPLFFPRMRQYAPMVLVLLCAAAVAGVYMQTLDYPFVSDDEVYITENTKLAGLHLAELWHLFTEPYNSYSEFLPLRELSYWLDMTLFGLNPAAFRLHNILLYLLCLPLVYATTLEFWRYFRPMDAASAPWVAAVVAALFALHPALVEPVVWVSGRKYVLPNLFSLLALWLAMCARRNQGLSAPHAASALIAFVVVMLSKSSYIGVAPLIALLWILFWLDIPEPNRCRSQLLWPFAMLFLAGLLFLIFIAVSGGTGATGVTPYFGIEVITRTLAVLGWLARLAVSPENRHFTYPVFEDPNLSAMVGLGVAVLAAAMTGVILILRKRSLEGFALVAFLLLCVPYMQLIPYLAPSLVQDRYLALAVWPVILLLVALSWRLKPVPRTALLLAIALPWGLQTIERPRDWRSAEVLVEADLRAYPGRYLPAFQKIAVVDLPARMYRNAIKTANSITIPELRDITIKLVDADYAVHIGIISTDTPQEAVKLLWKLGLDLKQAPAQSQWNSPMLYTWRFCRDLLASQWDYLAKKFPDDVSVRYNAGLWMLDDHRYLDAGLHLRAATESQRLPESVRGAAFKNLGLALLNSGYIAAAEAPLRAALEQSPPDLRAHCLLSKVYQQTKRFDEAARAETICARRASGKERAQ